MLDPALVTGALAAMDAATTALRAAASPDGHNSPTPLFTQQLALILEHGGLLMLEAATVASAQQRQQQARPGPGPEWRGPPSGALSLKAAASPTGDNSIPA